MEKMILLNNRMKTIDNMPSRQELIDALSLFYSVNYLELCDWSDLVGIFNYSYENYVMGN